MLQALAERDALPTRYEILEPSADLRQRQRQGVSTTLTPGLAARMHWLDAPPQQPWRGVLFANDVLDALQTPRFQSRDGEGLEGHVAGQIGRAACRERVCQYVYIPLAAVSLKKK